MPAIVSSRTHRDGERTPAAGLCVAVDLMCLRENMIRSKLKVWRSYRVFLRASIVRS